MQPFRTFRWISVLACFAVYSCVPFTKPSLPSSTKMELSKDFETIVHFTDALVSGAITFSGNTDGYELVFEKNLSVTVNYGKDKYDLSNSVKATIGDSKASWLQVIVPFTATLSNLEDGANYYFSVTAQFGGEAPINSTPIKFFTLPEGPVDFGLPSRTLWASCNLGASSPEESGTFYAWGETSAKKENGRYTWSGYKWCEGDYNKLTKYCTSKYSGYNGFVDNLIDLQPEDDAAVYELGGNWHTPTTVEWVELEEKCQWEYIVFNNVSGLLARSKTSPDDAKKVVFFPFSGSFMSTSISDKTSGYYWTASLVVGWNESAYHTQLSSMGYYNFQLNRCYGANIRPVCKK